MRQSREKVSKILYLYKYTSDFDKKTHDAYLYANSSYSLNSTILKQFFSYNKTKDNAIKSPKPNNCETIKGKVMKTDTTHPFIPSYYTRKFETLCLKNIFFPLKNKGVQRKSRGKLN